MSRKRIDAALAVSMHRDSDVKVRDIAAFFDCQCPAIYRAFRAQGYFTVNMIERRPPPAVPIYLPPAAPTREHNGRTSNCDKMLDALPIVYRDPCMRCGTRGDIGCKCSKARIGWHAG